MKRWFVNTEDYSDIYESSEALIDNLEFYNLSETEIKEELKNYRYMTMADIREKRAQWILDMEHEKKEMAKRMRPIQPVVDPNPYKVGVENK